MMTMGELLIGHPRLAVNQFDPENGCILCGKCLEGCPQGSILNSGNEIKKLKLAGKIDFIKGVVTSLKILESKMTEVSFKIESGEIKTINASHLFLGLGPIATPALLLKSNLITGPVKVKDSQVFYVMFLRILSPFKTMLLLLSRLTLQMPRQMQNLNLYYLMDRVSKVFSKDIDLN
jgi:ferredoxin